MKYHKSEGTGCIMYTSNVHWSVHPYFDEICDYLFFHQVMFLFIYQDIAENLSLENVS